MPERHPAAKLAAALTPSFVVQVALSKDGITEVHGLGTLSDVEKAGLEVTVASGSCIRQASRPRRLHSGCLCSQRYLTEQYLRTQGLKTELQGSIQKGIDFVAKRS